MNWSECLKTYRQQHHLSQHELGVKLGVTSTTIHRLETQKVRHPSYLLRRQLALLGMVDGEAVSQR